MVHLMFWYMSTKYVCTKTYQELIEFTKAKKKKGEKTHFSPFSQTHYVLKHIISAEYHYHCSAECRFHDLTFCSQS